MAIYRRYGGKYPLLPWLHCTEAVEHVFGMCRQIIKDFTVLDFYLMVPKLFIKLREAFFSSHYSDANQQRLAIAIRPPILEKSTLQDLLPFPLTTRLVWFQNVLMAKRRLSSSTWVCHRCNFINLEVLSSFQPSQAGIEMIMSTQAVNLSQGAAVVRRRDGRRASRRDA